MILLLSILFILSLSLWLNARRRLMRRERELSCIRLQLEGILREESRNFIRIPTSDRAVMELSASANRLLDSFYRRQTEYAEFQKSMRRVLTDISHDLKTPLTVISGYTEILVQKSENTGLPEEVAHLIQKLEQKTGEAVRLINRFFDLAKLESGDMALHPETTDAGRLCREVLLEYYDLLQNLQFKVCFPEETSPIYALADREALTRILKNLIDNAIRYGGDGRYLNVSVSEHPDTISIAVTDRGKGISPEEQPSIFRRTYRHGRKNRQNPSGSGLGLAISQKLAVQMGGTLSVTSLPCPETVFTLILPKSEKKVSFSREI